MGVTNNHINQDELQRYLLNQMTDRERNAFERELEGNPFAMEALEGLQSIPFIELEKDAEEITERIHAGKKKKQLIIWYRVAAGILLLTGLSTAFYFILSNYQSGEISQVTVQEKKTVQAAKEIKEPAEIPESKLSPKNSSSVEKTTPSVKKDDIPLTVIAEKFPAENAVQEFQLTANDTDTIRGINLETGRQVDIVTQQNEKKSKAYIIPAKGVETTQPSMISGIILSSDDKSPLPGVSVRIRGLASGVATDTEGKFSIPVQDSNVTLQADFIGMERKEIAAKAGEKLQIEMKPNMMALNEVVVAASGVQRKTESGAVTKIDMKNNTYQEAEPEGGYPEFNEYVRSKIRFPQQDSLTKRAVVVLEFSIGTNGHPEKIKIIKSPSQDYADIAIEILKEGPAWKPARQDERIINNTVRVRIQFKR